MLPPASVLMVHNHKPFNATASPPTPPLFLNSNSSAADGTAPDATTGLCADGSQPQLSHSMLQLLDVTTA